MSKRKTDSDDTVASSSTVKRPYAQPDVDTQTKSKAYDLPEHISYESLAEKYPGLKAYLLPLRTPGATANSATTTCRYTIDFKNASATRVLNRALLFVYFDLNVVLPDDALCPAVANRLNYIKWLRSNIVEEFWPGSTVCGLDVGTGASCIYPLLGVRYMGGNTRFVGTDINDASVSVARQNAHANELDDRIHVYLNSDRNTVFPIHRTDFTLDWKADADDSVFTFSMCNPPFYDSPAERQQLRQMKQVGRPTLDTSGKDDELYTEGGEEAFLTRLVNESAIHKTRVKWYTTMVGKKGTLKLLKSKIRGAGAKHISEGTLIQGRTTRWVLAWSFLDKTRFCLDVQKSADDARVWFEATMEELQISKSIVDREYIGGVEMAASYKCSAVKKTWTRQWRRQQQHKEENEQDGQNASGDIENKPVIEFKVGIVPETQEACHIHMYLDPGYSSSVLMSLYNHILRKKPDRENPTSVVIEDTAV
ncbi:hypothetical protein H4S06_002858 [Coemansia sp. BCRC 34490]|nr:hypothetical protein H4S06_002858 [Coemansia sp. BCRC 34490]